MTVRLGHGGCGSVWLQECVEGKRGIDRRAIKVIPRLNLKDKKDNYVVELEAIAKFSQKRVGGFVLSLLNKGVTDYRACSIQGVLSSSSAGTTMMPLIFTLPWNTFLLGICKSIWTILDP